MSDYNDTGPKKLRKWLWVVHAWYHLSGNPSTTEVLWVYTNKKGANEHEDFLKWKMTQQLGEFGSTEKMIKMAGISLRQSSKKLEKFLLDKFEKPADPDSREIPLGYMPFEMPTRMSKKRRMALSTENLNPRFQP